MTNPEQLYNDQQWAFDVGHEAPRLKQLLIEKRDSRGFITEQRWVRNPWCNTHDDEGERLQCKRLRDHFNSLA